MNRLTDCSEFFKVDEALCIPSLNRCLYSVQLHCDTISTSSCQGSQLLVRLVKARSTLLADSHSYCLNFAIFSKNDRIVRQLVRQYKDSPFSVTNCGQKKVEPL